MCRDVNATAGNWCINYLQQLPVRPAVAVIESFGIRKLFSFHLCLCVEFSQESIKLLQISKFWSVMKLLLPLLGHRKCVGSTTRAFLGPLV